MSPFELLFVTLGTAVIQGMWTTWARFVAEKKAFHTGATVAAISLLQAFIIVKYAHDWRLIAGVCIGGFFGSAAPIWWETRRKR